MLENRNYEIFREFVEEMEESNQITNQTRDAFYAQYVDYCKNYIKNSVWEWEDEEIIYEPIVFWYEMGCLLYLLVDEDDPKSKIVAKYEE